jgi:hypothetical protein
MRAGWKVWPIAAVMAFLSLASPGQSPPSRVDRLVLLLIDVETLACAPCSAPLDELGRALPSSVLAERLKGILIYRDPDLQGPSGRRGRIARVRWSGFARGHEVRFPAAFDDGQSFQIEFGAGFAAILVDFEAGTVRKIPGPIRAREIAEIVSFACR